MAIQTSEEFKAEIGPSLERVRSNTELVAFTTETDTQFHETQKKLDLSHNIARELSAYHDNLADSKSFALMRDALNDLKAASKGKVQILDVSDYVPMYKKVIHNHDQATVEEEVVVFKKANEGRYLLDETTREPVTMNLELWQARLHAAPPTQEAGSLKPDMSLAPKIDAHDGLVGVVLIIEKDAMSQDDMQKDQESLEEKVAVPIPTERVEVDRYAAEKWTTEEADPYLSQLRRDIVERIDCVSFNEFQSNLRETAKILVDTVKDRKYGILWDYKPHSSKRWVFELVQDELTENPPEAQSYFTPGWEAKSGNPTIEAMIDKGVDTFVVLDDAIYSGEQVINRAIVPIIRHALSEDFAKNHPDTKLKIVVAAPYMTNVFIEHPAVKQAKEMGFLDLIDPINIMPTLSESLPAEDLDILRSQEVSGT